MYFDTFFQHEFKTFNNLTIWQENINVTNEGQLSIIRSYIHENTVSSILEIMGVKRITDYQSVKKHQKIN